MASLFGTSGIRGRYGREVTPELAMSVGNAVGALGKRVVVAIDARPTSPILAEALASGAMQSGAEVVFLGLAPTPLLAYATMKWKCAGAMITASHNPPEYNGIKLFFSGREYSREKEAEVEKAIGKPLVAVAWDNAGAKETVDLSSEYIAFLLSKVDAAAIAGKPPRVLIDAGNAAASCLAPALLRASGCEVVELYCSEPGKFVRNLEPKKETLAEAAKLVVEKKCDFGIALDGDGDRAIAIDEQGKVLALDTQLAIFCSYFLSGTKTKSKLIVSTVEASLCVRESVEAAGGKILITPVGSGNVADEVLSKHACFGGEPCGEYVFPASTPCADGLLAALFIAEIF
ncbi:MAG: phosphoglucosamine mutase, partial [Candidatus Micrarchaeota archaeon]|nr:phosphoglucosamine mutase [Candidatus Micrarchaeota archaeon]